MLKAVQILSFSEKMHWYEKKVILRMMKEEESTAIRLQEAVSGVLLDDYERMALSGFCLVTLFVALFDVDSFIN